MDARFPWKAALAVLLLGGGAVSARTVTGPPSRPPLLAPERGASVGTSLLAEYYRDLPEPDEDEDPRAWAARLEKPLRTFRRKVAARYTEGTLQRALVCPDDTVRRAAALALHELGTMESNQALAARLHDGDPAVRQMASAALWAVWLRGDTEANVKELQRLMRLRDAGKALTGLNALILKAPRFAEAYNQRAILHFANGDFRRAIADCEKVLQLNPVHFGAASGMAQAYLRLHQPRNALKAFRAAQKINPNLDGVADAIRALERALGEEGKK
jgi:tetratricopeptide (TPR) repeat protein